MATLIAGAVIAPVPARADIDEPQLNAYARARLADQDGALAVAVSGYRAALAEDPSSVVVAMRSYRQGIESGDLTLALRAAHVLDAAGALPHDGTLLLALSALERKDWKGARLLAGRLESEENFAFIAPLLLSWVSIGEGEYVAPVVDASSRYGGLARRYVDEHIALQLLAQGKADAAIPHVMQAVSLLTRSQNGMRLSFAARLAALGRRDAALALLPADVPAFVRARARIAAGERIAAPALTPVQGYARLLARIGDDIAGESTRVISFTLARFACFADPGNAEYRIGIAGRLLAADQLGAALVEAGKVMPQSWWALGAADLRVDALTALGKGDEALALARTLTTWPDAGAPQQVRLASILLERDDFAGAAAAYRAAVGYYPEQKTPWSLLMLEGSALEQGGQWDAAKAVLEKAALLAPNEPILLNYLGYAQVERGQNVADALALLRRASAMRPNDPAITDSLGWAHYVAGDPASAVPVLERAVAAAPIDATINEHLGDAYWAVGRHYEARYAWAAARAAAEGSEGERLAAKLRDGLPEKR